MQCCPPAAHVITGGKVLRFAPNTFVCWCYTFAHALFTGSGAVGEMDTENEVHGAGLGHSQDFIMDSGCF